TIENGAARAILIIACQREDTMTAAAMRALAVVAFLPAVTAPAAGAPCTAASPDCPQWVSPGENASRLLVYPTYPLDERNEAVTRALVVVDGGARTGDNYVL